MVHANVVAGKLRVNSYLQSHDFGLFEGSRVSVPIARMNFKHLYYFWATANAGGVMRAAEQLHTTPQTHLGADQAARGAARLQPVPQDAAGASS